MCTVGKFSLTSDHLQSLKCHTCRRNRNDLFQKLKEPNPFLEGRLLKVWGVIVFIFIVPKIPSAVLNKYLLIWLMISKCFLICCLFSPSKALIVRGRPEILNLRALPTPTSSAGSGQVITSASHSSALLCLRHYTDWRQSCIFDLGVGKGWV